MARPNKTTQAIVALSNHARDVASIRHAIASAASNSTAPNDIVRDIIMQQVEYLQLVVDEMRATVNEHYTPKGAA